MVYPTRGHLYPTPPMPERVVEYIHVFGVIGVPPSHTRNDIVVVELSTQHVFDYRPLSLELSAPASSRFLVELRLGRKTQEHFQLGCTDLWGRRASQPTTAYIKKLDLPTFSIGLPLTVYLRNIGSGKSGDGDTVYVQIRGVRCA